MNKARKKKCVNLYVELVDLTAKINRKRDKSRRERVRREEKKKVI